MPEVIGPPLLEAPEPRPIGLRRGGSTRPRRELRSQPQEVLSEPHAFLGALRRCGVVPLREELGQDEREGHEFFGADFRRELPVPAPQQLDGLALQGAPLRGDGASPLRGGGGRACSPA